MYRRLPFLAALAFFAASFAQPAVNLPRQSPAASVSQTFGYTTVTVKYSRPAVGGRAIWGSLVPYGMVWRAGANEPTTVEFSRDASINGTPLSAGTYALFVLPEKKAGKDMWTFIFSRNTKGWGAFGYDPKDDALRVTVIPEKAGHQERLEFSFDKTKDAGATLVLHWERLRAPLSITSEFLETGKAAVSTGIPNIKDGDPFGWLHAARFYWAYDIDRAQALEWVDKSIAVKALHANLWTKAQWLAEAKRYPEAREVGKLAREAAAKDPGAASQIPEMDKVMKKWK